MNRNKKIIKISVGGIFVNLILAAFKAVVGLIANSVSVILDAVNNLTDILSSIVTIVGLRLSTKRPDRKHPFGYGRVEYFSAVVVAMIVLFAGGMAFKESIEKIITPDETDYSVISLMIIAVAVLVKFFFGKFVKKKGKELNSGSLIATGVDAMSDAILSLSVLFGAIVNFFWHVSLDGYIGVLIAVMIIKTAIEILSDAVNDLIGIRVDDEIIAKLKKTINNFSEVQGVYDLALHNYGPNKIIASAHIQISDELRTREIHRLSRRVETKVYEKYGIILTLGVYAANESGRYKRMKQVVEKIIEDYSTVVQIHGFYVDEEEKIISLDLVFDFGERNEALKAKEIKNRIKKEYSDYRVYIVLDTDV